MSGMEAVSNETLADAYLTKGSNFKENLISTISHLAYKPLLKAA
jgi:hypothetical protein